MVEIDKKDKPNVIFPVNANPPNMGHLMVINTLLEVANKIVILVYDKPEVLPTDVAITMLIDVLSNYTESDRIRIVKSPINFATLNELPDNIKNLKEIYTIATTSRHIYSNLHSKGYPYLIFIKKPLGWRDEFCKIAFMRSISLYNIESMNLEAQRRKFYDKQKR